MNTRRYTYKFLLLSLLAISCSKDDAQEPDTGRNYVAFTVQGARANGSYHIEKTDPASGVMAGCVYLPADAQRGEDAKVSLTLMDYGAPVGMTLVVPATEQRTQIIRDNPHAFELGFVFDFGPMATSEVSVHVTDLELREGYPMALVTRIKGSFEGVVFHAHTENGQRIEENHTVAGEFEYNMPQ